MEMSLEACWDCPFAFSSFLLNAAVVEVGLLLGVLVRRTENRLWRATGLLLLVASSLWQVLVSMGALRWGLTVQPVQYGAVPLDPWLAIVAIGSWLAVSLATVRFTRRGMGRRRSRATQ